MYFVYFVYFMNLDVGVGGRITNPGMTQWIQCKLGKQYLWKKSYTVFYEIVYFWMSADQKGIILITSFKSAF